MIFDTVTTKLFNKVLNGIIAVGKAKNADAVNGFTVYKSLAELGLTEATATPKAITEAMQNNSMLTCTMSGTAITSALATPFNWGMLRVHKISNVYTMFEYQNQANSGALQLARGYYNENNSTGYQWSGWHKIADADLYLLLTGGTIAKDTGDPSIAFHRKTDNTQAYLNKGLGNLQIAIRNVFGDGKNERRFYIYDSTQQPAEKAIRLYDVVDGVGTMYDILHTGNGLPLTGGTITGSVYFNGGASGADGGKIRLKAPTSGSIITAANVVVDVYGNTFRVFSEVDGAVRGFTMDFTEHTGYGKVLHTGNSNAVVFTEDDTTAPSNANALWAHL